MNVKSLAGDACEHLSMILTHAKYLHGFVTLFEAGAEKWDCYKQSRVFWSHKEPRSLNNMPNLVDLQYKNIHIRNTFIKFVMFKPHRIPIWNLYIWIINP